MNLGGRGGPNHGIDRPPRAVTSQGEPVTATGEVAPVTANADLRRVLGEDLEVVSLLSEAESSELLDLFEDARRRQQESLDASLDVVLGHLPRLLRGSARKILFG